MSESTKPVPVPDAEPPGADLKQPWDRLEGEPGKWYDRFDLYRLLGPARSLVVQRNELV